MSDSISTDPAVEKPAVYSVRAPNQGRWRHIVDLVILIAIAIGAAVYVIRAIEPHETVIIDAPAPVAPAK